MYPRKYVIGILIPMAFIYPVIAGLLIFALKKVMQEIIDNGELQEISTANQNSGLIKPIHHNATALRKSLSTDIGTRRRPFL